MPYGVDFLTFIGLSVVAGVVLAGAGLDVVLGAVLGAADGAIGDIGDGLVVVDGVVVEPAVVSVVAGLVVDGVVVDGDVVLGVVVLGDVVDGVTGAAVSAGVVRVIVPADESRTTRAVSVAGEVAGVGVGAGVVVGVWAPANAGAAKIAAARAMDFMSDFLRCRRMRETRRCVRAVRDARHHPVPAMRRGSMSASGLRSGLQDVRSRLPLA